MIVKILAHHNPSAYRNLLNYVLSPDKSMDGKVHVIGHNLRSANKNGYLREFIENEATRKYPRDGQICAYHEIISLSKEENSDHITREKLEDLTRQYFNLRGVDGVYLAAFHEDKAHAHVHIVSSAVKFRTGLANRISHQHLRDIKEKLQSYHIEKFPELTKSIVNHGSGKSYVSEKEWQAANREKRKLVKDTIIETVQDCFKKSASQSEFLKLLQNQNLHHYERAGKIQGIVSPDGLKFRFSRMEIDVYQLPQTELEVSEEYRITKLVEKVKNPTNQKNKMTNVVHQFALWHYFTGGEPMYDSKTNSYSLLTNDGQTLPITKSTYDEMLTTPVSPELEEIREIKQRLNEIIEGKTNPSDLPINAEKTWIDPKLAGELEMLPTEEARLSLTLSELMQKAENNFFFDLDLDDELALWQEINDLREGKSENFLVHGSSYEPKEPIGMNQAEDLKYPPFEIINMTELEKHNEEREWDNDELEIDGNLEVESDTENQSNDHDYDEYYL